MGDSVSLIDDSFARRAGAGVSHRCRFGAPGCEGTIQGADCRLCGVLRTLAARRAYVCKEVV